jgi:pimeloyl-ACP methyl ester carboxylesterase
LQVLKFIFLYNSQDISNIIFFLEGNMREKRVKTNQIELQIQDHENEGEAIIFLHFSGANLMMWQRALPWFQDHFRLILVDLRGHGRSDKPESGYDIDEMARDVIGVMEHLGLERAHVVGSSMGAEVGLSMAANHPEKVISLVCDGALSSEYGPYGTWEGSEEDYAKHTAEELEGIKNATETFYPSVEALVEARRKVFEKYGWWNEYVESMERYGASMVDEGKYAKGFRKQGLEDYMRHYFQCRFEDYYRKVKCPLLILPGEDALGDEREKRAMKGLIGLTELGEIVEVSGWVHPYGWLLNPEGVCKAILKFLGDRGQ